MVHRCSPKLRETCWERQCRSDSWRLRGAQCGDHATQWQLSAFSDHEVTFKHGEYKATVKIELPRTYAELLKEIETAFNLPPMTHDLRVMASDKEDSP